MKIKTRTANSAVLCVAMLAALFAAPVSSQAATVNFSSLETVLAEPTDMDAKMLALWTGWLTQLYEYNQPFIQITSEADDLQPITEFRMTIGDTNFRFDNEFLGKELTNASHIPADGRYALPGASNPSIDYNSFITDGGDELVIQFPGEGLGPGESAIFQVDVSPDDPDDKKTRFASYSTVFFNGAGGDDIVGNSIVTVEFGGVSSGSVTLPNLDLDADMVPSINAPRAYATMQTNTPLVPLDITDPIPEPTSMVLAAIGLAGAACGRRR
ncbi:MAG: PEP-CTERM sorting domain-containing protein [Planctomycetota bacterium]